MKILVADKFEKSGVQRLTEAGHRVVVNAEAGADGLPALLIAEDPDILVVRSTKVRAPAFEAAKRLSLVVRAGAGVDNIDVTAASNRGIFVANCPGKNAIAVAELVWGLILGCDRRIADQTGDLRRGVWNKKEYSKARGLFGRTLGIIGMGVIGQEVARRGRAFGMEVLAWSRSLNAEAARNLGVTACPNPISVAHHADVISVNVAATGETAGLIGAEFCAAMKPGTIFINTSRGSVVDEPALLRAASEKHLRLGLDVFENEPGGAEGVFKTELSGHPSVTGTHHIGASTDQAQQAIAEEAVRVILAYAATGDAPNVVNRCAKSPATRLLVVRHLNRPGVLAHVVGEIGRASINIEEMDNVIYHGAEAACARIRLDAEPDNPTLSRIATGCPHILSVEVTAIS